MRVGTIAAIVVLATSLCACSPASTSRESNGGAGERGTILFDIGHGEIFAPDDTSELGQSEVVAQMRDRGYEVRVNEAPLDPTALANVAAVYVPGPMRPFTDVEKAALDDYLERGGTVVLSIHVPYPVRSTPARWGLPVGTGVMQLTGDVPPGADPGYFTTDEIVDDPLTRGVKSIAVASGWPLKTDPTKLAAAKMVVTATGDIAADTNGDGRFDGSDDQPPYGVVGVAPVGSGRVIVLGDDAIFANLGITAEDNAKLLDNILEIISAPKGA